MADTHRKERSQRSSLAAHFDMFTLAALTTAGLLLVAAVVHLGGADAADRIGCGLNAYVNSMMAYPRPCYVQARKVR